MVQRLNFLRLHRPQYRRIYYVSPIVSFVLILIYINKRTHRGRTHQNWVKGIECKELQQF